MSYTKKVTVMILLRPILNNREMAKIIENYMRNKDFRNIFSEPKSTIL
jgi:hypothetical protein